MAAAAGVELDVLHVPTDALAAADPELQGSLWGDKAHSLVFDNAKIRRLVPDFDPAVPFARGHPGHGGLVRRRPVPPGGRRRGQRALDRVAAVYAEALRRVAA